MDGYPHRRTMSYVARQQCLPHQLLLWNTALQLLQCMLHQLRVWSKYLLHQQQATPRQRLQCLPHHFLSWTTYFQLWQCVPHQLLWWSTLLTPAARYAVPARTVTAAFPVVKYISPDPAGYAAPASVLECKLRRASACSVCTSHQNWRELQRFYRCNRGSSSLAFTSRFGLHARVHFHARVSTLASAGWWAAVPPMPADRWPTLR